MKPLANYNRPVRSSEDKSSTRVVFLIVLCVSALCLLLQLVQTRIFSYVYWYHLMYYVVTMALLGFAASGTALSISDRLRRLDNSSFLALCLAGFSLTAYASTQIASHPFFDTRGTSLSSTAFLGLTAVYAFTAIPYFFAGLTIAGAFMRLRERSSMLYCASLGGSGIGCLLFVLLITPLGAPKLLLATSLSAVLLIPLLHMSWRRAPGLLLWTGFLIYALFQNESNALLRLVPVGNKQYWYLIKKPVMEFSQWNPISRIDVIANSENWRERHILMDGDAQAWLVDVSKAQAIQKDTQHALLYKIHDTPPGHGLIIGAGGGFDVHVALGHGAKELDAVEFNPSTVAVVTGAHAKAIGDVFSKPNVHLHEEDGRSFVRRSSAKYDTLMMYTTDSLVGLSTGAYILADSYLYTVEAFQDYLAHLSEGGMMQVCRWSYPAKPREDLRTFCTAVEACRRSGYQHPFQHVAVVQGPEILASVLVKQSEFTPEDMERIKTWCKTRNANLLFPRLLDESDPPKKRAEPFLSFAEAFENGRQGDFYNHYEFDVEPVSDDNPFFFQYNRWDFLFNKNAPRASWDYIRGSWSNFVLLASLLQSILLSALLVCLPLWLRRRGDARMSARFATIGFFSALGFGFMLAEIALIQKCVLFLGHPGYSLALTMPAILMAAGVGSYVSNQASKPGRAIVLACLFSALLIVTLRYALPWVTPWLLRQPLPLRAIGCLLLLVPSAFCMGFPFPLAIKTTEEASIPWAWAINGTASVVASVVAILLAMTFGFSIVLWAAAGCYLLGAVTAPRT